MPGTDITGGTPVVGLPRPDGTQKTTTRGRRARNDAVEQNNGYARYFLGKADKSGGAPALDREVLSEGEALVEALRMGVTYYAVQEFRVVPDFSGTKPQLNKEAVHGK